MTTDNAVIGRDLLASAISNAGIDTVFTVAGGHFLPTYNSIGRQASLAIVAARHEQGAGYMASGYALTTGKPGVVFSGAPGPGATNLITAVANAHADSIPLLVLSAQVDRRYIHRNILQYCDNVSLFAPFCKRSVQAVSLEEVPNLIATGLQLAVTGRPGPVHIALPQNLQAEQGVETTLDVADSSPCLPSSQDVDALAALLANSKKPAILAGHGVLRSGSAGQLEKLAASLGAPVATSRSGVGSINTNNPLSMGMLGFYGPNSARDAMAAADTVLIIGCALGEQTTFGWRPTLFAEDAQLIQVDADASQINRVYPVKQGIVCDAGSLLDALDGQFTGKREAWFSGKPERSAPQNNPAQGLSAAEVMQTLNQQASDKTIVTADIGNHRLWVCEQLDIKRPEALLQSCEFDAMGFSLPAAIGACVAEPTTRIISISGDGGFVHTMGELAVAKELGVSLVAIVFVDGALGILKHQAEEMYGEHHFVRLESIDFAKVADAMGVPSRTVAETAALDDAFTWAMQADGPVLLSVQIDPDEIFPPLRTKIEQRKIDLLGKK